MVPPVTRTDGGAPNPAAYVRYYGKAPITAVGPITGRVYRFEGAGATHAVDPQDAASLSGIPKMRRIANP
jgi:hypothetical protein